jgi:hypothetical protein
VCRLVVGGDGRDVDERGEFRVVIGTADVAAPHQPIEHYMGDGALDGPPLHLGKKIPMHGGTEFGLPFALPLPADAAPTSSAVHSSLS